VIKIFGNSNASKEQKCARMTIENKIELCEFAKLHPSMSQTDLGNWIQRQFNMPSAPKQTTVSDILKGED
jgi:arsenate reductase-like glutaredoxin family protein